MDIVGFSGLQAVFGGTVTTWKGRIKAGLPVKSEPGLRSGKARIFDSVEVHHWLVANEPARLPGGELLDRNQEQAWLFRVQRERQALLLATEQGELIPASIVETVWAGMTGAARQRLLGLPSRLAAQCSQAEHWQVEAAATSIVHEALNQIHDFDPADYLGNPARNCS